MHPWTGILAAVFLLLLIYPPAVLMEVRVNFEDEAYEKGARLKLLTSVQEDTIPFSGLQTTYGKKGESRIYFLDPIYRKGSYLRRLDPIDTDSQPIVSIRSLELFCNGLSGGSLSGEELLRAFTSNEQAEMSLNSQGNLELVIMGNDSQLFPTEYFQSWYSRTALHYSRAGVLYLLALFLLAAGLGGLYGRLTGRREERLLNITDVILWLTAAGAVCLLVTAVLYGDHTRNPDEWESRDAVRYYMDHLLPPDIRSPEVRHTIGTYGTTRLAEWTPFYFYAGKVAALFSVPHAERLFGLLLGIGLFLFVLFQARKNRYLLAVCFLTPQVWYLYAYCTSDALDYVVSVLVLYQLAKPDSMLNSLVRRGAGKRDVLRILLLGTLFAHVLTAKANYYVILIYAFFMLLVPLVQAQKAERKRMLQTYLWILLSTLCIFGIRYGIDVMHYGFQKEEVVLQMKEEMAIYELKPSTPPEDQAFHFKMADKGISPFEFLKRYGLPRILFESAAGIYGGMNVRSGGWYYLTMAVLYLMLYGGISVSIWKNRRENKALAKWLLLHAVALVSYLLVLYNGYFIDYQMQGRYMLPVFILLGHGASLEPGILKSRWFQILLCITAVLSLYSFAAGIPQLREL